MVGRRFLVAKRAYTHTHTHHTHTHHTHTSLVAKRAYCHAANKIEEARRKLVDARTAFARGRQDDEQANYSSLSLSLNLHKLI